MTRKSLIVNGYRTTPTRWKWTQLADWLHLDAEARINTPSTQGSNWQWRLTRPLTPALSAHIAELTALYHRVPDEEL